MYSILHHFMRISSEICNFQKIYRAKKLASLWLILVLFDSSNKDFLIRNLIIDKGTIASSF